MDKSGGGGGYKQVFGGVCVCCPLVFEFSVGIGGFVI